jgi:serine O-acetyltransferase
MTTGSIFFLLRSDLIRFTKAKADINPFKLWIRLIHPRFIPVFFVRLSNSFYKRQFTRPFSIIFTLLNGVLFGLEVTPKCKIGKGMCLPHTFGTVIGAAEIGDNVTIFQGVTLGAKYADSSYTETSRPIVGNNVVFGAGAKALGAITIGNNSVIAANSLVTSSVPVGAFMIGVPATIKYINDNE